MSITLVILWILATFVIGTAAGVIGKRFGVEYPIALVSALVVMANVFASKIVVFGDFTVPAGVIVFSMIFFITDLISEKWGKESAKKAVWSGFFASFAFLVSSCIVLHWQPAEFSVEISNMFNQVFVLTPGIAIAGFVAYLISQNHDIWAFHFWKKLTKGKHLWLRNNASTIVSQFLDSTIFVSIAFYGVFPIWPLIFGQWLVKIIIALIDTPFLYLTIWLIGKVEKVKNIDK